MEHVNLTGIDLILNPCPVGTEVEIVGFDKRIVVGRVKNLLDGIAIAYSMLTRQVVFSDEHFIKRITVTELDEKKKLVKVRIASAD